jgi:putative ABC transport system permease protein
LALGAQASGVLRMVIGQGVRLAAAGVLLGVSASVLLSKWVASQLYDISPYDPLTLGCVSSFVVAVTLLACLIPARRAARVDPMVALRHE